MYEYDLTTPQKNILSMIKKYPNSSIANITGKIVISNTPFDYDKINLALNLLIKLNDSCRIKIFDVDGITQQRIDEYQFNNFPFIDLSDLSAEEKTSLYEEWAKIPIDNNKLLDWKILKLNEDEAAAYISVSHLICDAFSVGLLGQQFNKIYYRLLNDLELNLEETPSYLNLLSREKQYIESNMYIKDKEFFYNLFKEQPTKVTPALSSSDSIDGKRLNKNLPENLTNEIKKYCIENKISEPVFFESVVFSYLNLISKENSNCIGSAVLNRKIGDEKNTPGMYVNTSFIKVDFDKDMSFNDLTKAVTTSKITMLRKQLFPITKINEILNEKFNFKGSIFDVMVSYQNAKMFDKNTEEKIDSKIDWQFSGSLINDLIINIDDLCDSNQFDIGIDYKTAIFTEKDIENLYERLNLIIVQVLNNKYLNINDLDIMTNQDIKEYEQFNNQENISTDKTVIQLFEEQVIKNSDKIAVCFNNTEYTYKQVNELVNSLANQLNKTTIDDIIPIVGERSIYTIIALLALAKLNKTYIILDTKAYNCDIINEMIEGLDTNLVITYDGFIPKKNQYDLLEEKNWSNNFENIGNYIENSKVFCLLCTSGTTGKPKFVQISDIGITNMAYLNNQFIYDCESSISLISMSFDAFTEDVFMPLLNGKKLILPTNTEIEKKLPIEEYLNTNEKIYLNLTPSRMKQFINLDGLTNVNTIVLGGEKIEPKLLKEIKRKAPNSKIYNLYGPCETTVFCSAAEITNNEISIGKPISNFKIFICNDEKMMPPGVLGEICVVGKGVSKGYLNEHQNKKNDFGYIYKTGDLGVIKDGNLHFLGRLDNQIKINGVRIEVEELEHILSSHENIDSGAISIQFNKRDEPFLVGYYVSDDMNEKEVLEYMKSKLPSFKVPLIYIKLSKIPLNSNGKLDRKQLPEFSINEVLNNTYVQPATDLEEKVSEIFKQVLKLDFIGVETEFSYLGGTSKTKEDLFYQINKTLGVNISSINVPVDPTVRDICSSLLNTKKDKINIDKYKTFQIKEKQEYYNAVLLTGAGGYLGSHILAELVKDKSLKVYCLIRDKNKFLKSMYFYFNDQLDLSNVEFIIGDISKDNLGVNMSDYNKLKKVDKVINSAANVSHVSSISQSKKDNVDGVYNLIKLLKDSGATLEQMSTITISGIGITSQKNKNLVFDESCLDIGQDYTHDAYMYSKYKAEEMIKIFKDYGLKANIYRFGYVNARSYDGIFQINDDTSAFKLIVDTINELKIIPESARNIKIQHAPVDMLSKFTKVLMDSNKVGNTYHMYDPNNDSLFDYLDSKNIKYDILPDNLFFELIDEVLKNSNNIDHKVVYKYLNGYINNPTSNIISCKDTIDELKNLGIKEGKCYTL